MKIGQNRSKWGGSFLVVFWGVRPIWAKQKWSKSVRGRPNYRILSENFSVKKMTTFFTKISIFSRFFWKRSKSFQKDDRFYKIIDKIINFINNFIKRSGNLSKIDEFGTRAQTRPQTPIWGSGDGSRPRTQFSSIFDQICLNWIFYSIPTPLLRRWNWIEDSFETFGPSFGTPRPIWVQGSQKRVQTPSAPSRALVFRPLETHLGL